MYKVIIKETLQSSNPYDRCVDKIVSIGQKNNSWETQPWWSFWNIKA